jgi:GDP-4-dehydro-6-deoxy-D-mannose reductase
MGRFMTKHALVAGITGQDGANLAQLLLEKVLRAVDRSITETEPLNPINQCGVSKAAADMLGYRYAVEGLRVVRARPFNHSGPGQSPDFLLPALIEKFAEIKAGRRERIVYLGEVSVRELFELVRREVDMEVRLSVEPSRMRATDIPYLVADAGKVHRELGWKAKIPLAQTIKEMLETAE